MTIVYAPGARIETVSQHPDERDAGRIIEIDGDRALISWDSGTRTWTPISDIRAEG